MKIESTRQTWFGRTDKQTKILTPWAAVGAKKYEIIRKILNGGESVFLNGKLKADHLHEFLIHFLQI